MVLTVHANINQSIKKPLYKPPLPLSRSSKFWRVDLSKSRSQVRTQNEAARTGIDEDTQPPFDENNYANEQTFFKEEFNTTVYVEKDDNQMNSAVPARKLLKAEVVPESPSSKLLRLKHPKKEKTAAGNLQEILWIVIPALGTVLADPFMSLVDTACVGQISATQLAALGPNTAIFNMIFSIFSFMGVALANIIARNSAKAQGLTREERKLRMDKNEKLLSHTIIAAVSVGVVITLCLFTFGSSLLRFMGASQSVMESALGYLYVRAVGMPAVLFMAVSQGACLGQQDMWTPMKVMLASGLVNLIGDIALIMGMGMGTFGAGLATAVSQIAGAAFFFFYLVKGGSKGKSIKLKLKGVPTLRTLSPILDMGRILVSRSIVLMASYTAMTTAATSMGTFSLAAHQVTLQLFWLLSIVADPLSLTAQTLLARDSHNKAKTEHIIKSLLTFGAGLGLVIALIFGGVLKFAPGCFTQDPGVISVVQSVIPHGMISLVCAAIAVTFDGIAIGSGALDLLPKIFTAASVSTFAFVWITQRMRLGLAGVWTAMIILFTTRVFFHSLRFIKQAKIARIRPSIRSHAIKLAEN